MSVRQTWKVATARGRRNRLDPRNLPRDILEMVRDYTLPHVRDNMVATLLAAQHPDRYPIGVLRGQIVSQHYLKDSTDLVLHGETVVLVAESMELLDIDWQRGEIVVVESAGTRRIGPDGNVYRESPGSAKGAIEYSDGFRRLPSTLVRVPCFCHHAECLVAVKPLRVIVGCADRTEFVNANYMGNYSGCDFYRYYSKLGEILLNVRPDGTRMYLVMEYLNFDLRVEYPMAVAGESEGKRNMYFLDPYDFSQVGFWDQSGSLNCHTDGGRLYAADMYNDVVYRLD